MCFKYLQIYEKAFYFLFVIRNKRWIHNETVHHLEKFYGLKVTYKLLYLRKVKARYNSNNF